MSQNRMQSPARNGAQSPGAEGMSPLQSPRGKEKKKGGGGGLFGDLLGMYYNGKASLNGALSGEVRLPDDLDAWVLGRNHKGQNTTEWATRQVQCVSYFTYRNRLPTPLSNGLDNDAGWGCMIRTGQMMFCECLQHIHTRAKELRLGKKQGSLGGAEFSAVKRQATVTPSNSSFGLGGPSSNHFLMSPNGTALTPGQTDEKLSDFKYEMMENFIGKVPNPRTLFTDTPDAPFGLHSLSDAGARAHIKVGEWFNPTALSFALVDLVGKSQEVNDVLKVVIARDGLLVRSEVLHTLRGNPGSTSVPGLSESSTPAPSATKRSKTKSASSSMNPSFASGGSSLPIPRVEAPKSVLVVIPLMLGAGGSIQPSYYQSIARCFHLPNTLGIVGGKPKMSLYFVGEQNNDTVFYLDPHVVQPAYLDQESEGNIFGPRGTAKMSTLDSCMLLSFVFHTVEEFLIWEQEFKEKINPLTEYPMFSIAENAPKEMDLDDMDFDMDDTDDEDEDGNDERSEDASDGKVVRDRQGSAVSDDFDASTSPAPETVDRTTTQPAQMMLAVPAAARVQKKVSNDFESDGDRSPVSGPLAGALTKMGTGPRPQDSHYSEAATTQVTPQSSNQLQVPKSNLSGGNNNSRGRSDSNLSNRVSLEDDFDDEDIPPPDSDDDTCSPKGGNNGSTPQGPPLYAGSPSVSSPTRKIETENPAFDL